MSKPAQWIETPENRSAFQAVRRAARCMGGGRACGPNPLFLHGPSGTGKTHLIDALLAEMSDRRPDLTATVLAAREAVPEVLRESKQADLFVVEDLQQFDRRAAETLADIIDERIGRRSPMVFTATHGPGRLDDIPARLASRLASGLVVGLEPLPPASRALVLRRLAEQRSVTLSDDLTDWLASHIGGSVRRLEGALERVAALQRLEGRPVTTAEAGTVFEEADARTPTMERIVQGVGELFLCEPDRLRTRDRSRNVLLPRQVGMYLARRLTSLSLDQIGEYFGGRDHSTVLHACRKVEEALGTDPHLSGIVRRLHADLA